VAARPPIDPDEGPDLVSTLLDRVGDGVRFVRRLLARALPGPVQSCWAGAGRALNRRLPKSLFGRSMLIVVLPIVILLAVLTQVFIDRHYQLVTRRLSDAVARDVGAVVDLVKAAPDERALALLERTALKRLDMAVTLRPEVTTLRPPPPRTFFSLLDDTLSSTLNRRITEPLRLDTVSFQPLVEVEVLTAKGVLRILFPRNNAYAANSHIFLVWMVVTALFLVIVAVVFLRNQIRPIQRLAVAAEMVGRGRTPKDFVPSGAREVRQAALAFIEMRRRIERQIEQRTTMLAGVSHDLRTILTRFKLELALLPESEEVEAMRGDVDNMAAMLEAYLAFARGVADEDTQRVRVRDLVADIESYARRAGRSLLVDCPDDLTAALRPIAFRRMLGNLVGNAARFGRRVEIRVTRQDDWMTIHVDDDGPGIPPEQREAVFRPFHRLDVSRNQDIGGSGLGLAIARDIALSHGGDIRLMDAPIGGLRVQVRIPV